MIQSIFINKCIVGIMALFVMFGMNNLLFTKHGVIDAKIYRHEKTQYGNKFYGDLIIGDKKMPIIINVEEDTNNKTYNYNEDKTYDENKQYNENKQHNINNNINKKEEIINKNEQKINNNSNINKKEDKHNENIKITDDKTPGSFTVTIKNDKGEERIIYRDMGSREMSEIDGKCFGKIIDGVMEDISKSRDGSIRKGVIEKIKGFKDYLNKPKNSRWLNWTEKK